MKKCIEATLTRGEGFLRAVIFLKDGIWHIDAPMSAIFCSGEKEHIFIPAPNDTITDPVYPAKDSGEFVYRIEKGIYCATLFAKKEELDQVRRLRVFASGEEIWFDVWL